MPAMNRSRSAALVATLAALAALAGCHSAKSQAPTRDNFTAALDDYLEQRGHLCVAKYDWPIVVTDADVKARSLDAQQMPYLEALGLATHRETQVSRPGADGAAATLPAREYTLSAQGEKYYLHVPVVVATPTQRVTHAADLCVAKLTLDRLFGWEKPQTINGRTATSLLFSYRIVDPAPWMQTADARHAFPMAMRAIDNAGVLQLRLGVHLTPDGWIADELTD
jgi:hypothetical protein